MKSLNKYKKYLYAFAALIAAVILFNLMKKNSSKFGGTAESISNIKDSSSYDSTKMRMIINGTTTQLTWLSSAAGNQWKPSASAGVKSVPAASGSTSGGTATFKCGYQYHPYDTNYSLDMFFGDTQYNTYENNNCKATYIFYDWKTVGGIDELYIAFSSLSDCPGCSGLVKATNTGLTAGSYNLPFTCSTNELFDNNSGTVTSRCNQCGSTALTQTATITYLNLTGRPMVWGSGTDMVTLQSGREIDVSTLYPAGATAMSPMTQPNESKIGSGTVKRVYNVFPGMYIESVSGGDGSSDTKRRTIVYRNLTQLIED